MRFGLFDPAHQEYVNSRIMSENEWLRTQATIPGPRGAFCELPEIRVPVVESSHPGALRQFCNADWVLRAMPSRAVRDAPCTMLLQAPLMM